MTIFGRTRNDKILKSSDKVQILNKICLRGPMQNVSESLKKTKILYFKIKMLSQYNTVE